MASAHQYVERPTGVDDERFDALGPNERERLMGQLAFRNIRPAKLFQGSRRFVTQSVCESGVQREFTYISGDETVSITSVLAPREGSQPAPTWHQYTKALGLLPREPIKKPIPLTACKSVIPLFVRYDEYKNVCERVAAIPPAPETCLDSVLRKDERPQPRLLFLYAPGSGRVVVCSLQGEMRNEDGCLGLLWRTESEMSGTQFYNYTLARPQGPSESTDLFPYAHWLA